jgi:hypothetical protein
MLKIFKRYLVLNTILLLSAVFLLSYANHAHAAADWTIPTFRIPIDTVKLTNATDCNDPVTGATYKCVPWISEYVSGIYKFAVGIVGILAAIMLMAGGFVWLTAGGSGEKVSQAQSMIKGSLTGLILTMGAYTLLSYINPALVIFKDLKIQTITPIGCCYHWTDANKTKVECLAAKKTDCNFTYAEKSCDQVNYCSKTLDRTGCCKPVDGTNCRENTTERYCLSLHATFLPFQQCNAVDGCQQNLKSDCNETNIGAACITKTQNLPGVCAKRKQDTNIIIDCQACLTDSSSICKPLNDIYSNGRYCCPGLTCPGPGGTCK